MVENSETDSWLTLCDDDGKERFQIVALSGREAVSELFSFQLQLRRPAEVPGDVALLGKPVEVRLRWGDNKSRSIFGVFRKFVRLGADRKYARFAGELVPRLWPITMNRSCRIFQDRTAPEIIQEVLRNYTIEFRLKRENYIRRNTCVQYMESDFAFALRLMEDEGIHYYFDHSRKGQLVVADNSATNPMLVEPSKLKFNETRGQFGDGGRIYWLKANERMTIPRLQLLDQCFEKKNPRIAAEAEVFSGKPDRGGKWGPNWGDYVESFGAVAHHFDAIGPNREDRSKDLEGIGKAVKQTAELRAGQRAAQFARTTADSDYLHVAPGYRFELVDADVEDNGNYLIVGVDHDYRLVDGGKWEIGNRLDCLRSETAFRPPLRATKPSIRGLHSAIVKGPTDATIWTDPFGRVQVRFFWEDDVEHTCWLRVAQSWAGDGFGALATPRVGHEVLIGFLHGDPDQPVVMKSLHNADNLPAFDPAEEPGTNGFYSQTNKSGATKNDSSHFLFVDAAGKEQVHLHAQNHAHISAEYAMVQTVGWGAGDTGALSYLSGSSQATAGNVWGDIKQSIFGGGSWQAGFVSKVKGVERHSVWGHEIDVTLGTSHDFVVGAWSRGNVGLGVALDVGFRTDVMIGFDVKLNIAPHYVFCFGNRFDYTTGERFISTAKDLLQVAGQDFVEKIGGDRITMMGNRLPIRRVRDSSGNHQSFDVAAFSLLERGPHKESPDGIVLSELEALRGDRQYKALGMSLIPLPWDIENPQIADALKSIGELRTKYGIQLIDSSGGILIGSSHPLAELWVVGDLIEFTSDQFNVYAESVNFGDRFLIHLADGQAGQLVDSASVRSNRMMVAANNEARQKLLTAQTTGKAKALAAVPGVAVAGVALAGSIVAAANVDPNQWGL